MNLLRETLERLQFEHLIEEGRDPVEVLHYKYQNVPTNVIDAIIEIDPTKKKSYSQWLLSKWDNEKDTILHNLKNGRIAKLFQHYKTHNDIQIKDCPSVEEGLRAFVPEEDTVLVKSSAPTTTLMNNGWVEEVDSRLANDFDIVFNEDNWVIAVPHTYEADCKLGENMYWCTAGGRSDFRRGRDYYDEYLSRDGGRYYVNFDMSMGESRLGKDYPFTRYQFHFESRQFMDKNDDPVQLDEIGIPESAIRFYESEGYDTSDFENEELRWQRYDEQRGHSYYQLNDDLYLNIEFDINYEYREPNELTDFYVFSNDDERDPISYDEIPNPFTDDGVVIINKEDYIVLKAKYGDENDVEVLINEIGSNRYNPWEAYKASNVMELPGEIGLFGLAAEQQRERHYAFYCTDGEIKYLKFPVYNCERIFINEACTKADKWGRVFVETVNGGYHSLFAMWKDNNGSDLICIVKRDDPVNGEYYFINENGAVEGLYGKYRAYDDGTDDGQEYTKYNLVRKLPNGDTIVSIDVTHENKYGEKTYEELCNIIKNGQKELLFHEWMYEIDILNNLYAAKHDSSGNIISFYTLNGEQVGEDYNRIYVLDKPQGIVVGVVGEYPNYKKFQIVNSINYNIIGEFKDIITSKPVDNKIVVRVTGAYGNDTCMGFDYIEGKFCYPEFESMRPFNRYESDDFLCQLKGREEMVIFDFSTQRIIANNVKGINVVSSYDRLYSIQKMDGKYNILSGKDNVIILPYDVVKIVDTFERSGNKRTIIYYSGGKNFLYEYSQGKGYFLSNPNGFKGSIYFDNYGYVNFADADSSIIIRFWIDGENKLQLKDWSLYNKNHPSYTRNPNMNENVPPEVMAVYNEIIGQQPQPTQTEDPAYAVAEDFKRLMNRINEVRKLLHNDILD